MTFLVQNGMRGTIGYVTLFIGLKSNVLMKNLLELFFFIFFIVIGANMLQYITWLAVKGFANGIQG